MLCASADSSTLHVHWTKVAQRAKVAGHTLRRPRTTPNVRDALLFPATVPSVV